MGVVKALALSHLQPEAIGLIIVSADDLERGQGKHIRTKKFKASVNFPGSEGHLTHGLKQQSVHSAEKSKKDLQHEILGISI